MGFQIRLLFLIGLITLINYFDRSAISFAISPMQQELGLSDAEFGLILGAFGIGYLPMAFLSKSILDRMDTVRVWGISAAIWSICTLLFGFASGFWPFLLLRVVLGLAEGLHFPALIKIVSDWLHPAYRTRAVSFVLFGMPLASFIGAPLFTSIINALDWRWMFIILGVFGLIWVLLWPLCFGKRKNPRYGEIVKRSSSETFWKMVKHPSFIGSCIAYFCFGYLAFFELLWLPGFLEKQMNISMRYTGFILMIPWGLTLLLMIAGGFVSDRLWAKTGSIPKARSYLTVGGLLIAGISFFYLPYADHLYTVMAILSLGVGFGFLMNSPIYAMNLDFFPNQMAAAQGIRTGFFALAGILSPILTGFLVQWYGTFQLVFFLIALVALSGSAAVFFLHRKDS
jgi:ACS family hexuronate transporter-like MFS transporter